MEKLTKLELELMNILWRRKEASVREVQEAIVDRKRPAYTTVQTVLLRLEEKGAVRRTRKIGNAFMFEPAITRKSAYRRLFDDFLELIGGQSEPLVAHLLDSGKLTLDDLKALEDARRGSDKKGTKR
jgi:predicted transcriptional regulator